MHNQPYIQYEKSRTNLQEQIGNINNRLEYNNICKQRFGSLYSINIANELQIVKTIELVEGLLQIIRNNEYVIKQLKEKQRSLQFENNRLQRDIKRLDYQLIQKINQINLQKNKFHKSQESNKSQIIKLNTEKQKYQREAQLCKATQQQSIKDKRKYETQLSRLRNQIHKYQAKHNFANQSNFILTQKLKKDNSIYQELKNAFNQTLNKQNQQIFYQNCIKILYGGIVQVLNHLKIEQKYEIQMLVVCGSNNTVEIFKKSIKTLKQAVKDIQPQRYSKHLSQGKLSQQEKNADILIKNNNKIISAQQNLLNMLIRKRSKQQYQEWNADINNNFTQKDFQIMLEKQKQRLRKLGVAEYNLENNFQT